MIVAYSKNAARPLVTSHLYEQALSGGSVAIRETHYQDSIRPAQGQAMRNKKLYPPNWAEIARACKDRAGWKCEHCQIAQGETRISRRGRPYKIWLQAAHEKHIERAQEDAGLLCLCISCHARYDYLHDQRIKDIRLHSLKHKKLITPRRVAQARKKARLAHV